MMPLSYQGFGFTAILMMIAILSVAQLLKYLKERFYQHGDRTDIQKISNGPSIEE
jgi:hypothetical protein